jgi:hypothetical protein
MSVLPDVDRAGGMNVLPDAKRRVGVNVLRVLAALISGVLFGSGLALSGMVDPARIRGFLDVTGHWNPSLGFVLVGAVIVATIGYRLSLKLARPVLDDRFHLPTRTKIDLPLLAGSAIFGIGWGLAGLCPGAAITALSIGIPQTFLFVVAMLVGMVIHDRFVAAK